MKKILVTFAVIFAFVMATQAQGVLKFSKENHDFGKLEEGPLATYNFEVTNTGTAPVVISNAMARALSLSFGTVLSRSLTM